jgi:ribosomal protein L16 Arg81 hydroxylase
MQVCDWLAQRLRKLEWLLNMYGELDSQAPSSGIIERKKNVSREDFFRNYYRANRPVILTDIMRNWRALSLWTPDYLKDRFGHAEIEIMDGRDSDPLYEINGRDHVRSALFGDYIDKVLKNGESNDYYMVANNYVLDKEPLRELLNDIEIFPEYLDQNNISKKVSFWFGPKGTITPLHHDISNVFMAQVRGRKLVKLIPSYQLHMVYNHLGVYSEVDCEHPNYLKHPLFQKVDVMSVTLEPGEALFIPVGWWHYVRALDVSMTISFINFIYSEKTHWKIPYVRKPYDLFK